MKAVWSPTALDDLKGLRTYIAEHDPAAAAAVAGTILDAVDTLKEFPAMGRAGRVPGTREFVITGYPYVVVYTVADEELRIITVLHTARRWPPRRQE